MYSLELGAGSGLVGLGVALACSVNTPIYISDQVNMLSLMEQNVKLNGLESRVVPLVLNWLVYPLKLDKYGSNLMFKGRFIARRSRQTEA